MPLAPRRRPGRHGRPTLPEPRLADVYRDRAKAKEEVLWLVRYYNGKDVKDRDDLVSRRKGARGVSCL